MGYRHSAEEILEAAVAITLESGLTALTYSRVGERLGISDRTVVYYFPSKLELINAVADALVTDMVLLLEEAFGSEPLSQKELMKRAWPALTTASADKVFSLYFEIVGLATSGQAPYDTLATGLVAGWVDWLEPRMLGGSADVRRRRALATVAQIDGLLLVRHVLGAAPGDAAAREAGIFS
ncbi:MAG TPA: TetR/AcrR family transcriptional regulator [Acidimicrobiales bacterium]